MPTSGVSASRVQPSARRGTPPVAGSGGGQSAAGQPELLPPGPVSTGALTPTASSPDHGFAGFGFCASGQTGKRADCRSGGTEIHIRRRWGKNWGHSPPRSTAAVFRFLFAMSSHNFAFSSSARLPWPSVWQTIAAGATAIRNAMASCAFLPYLAFKGSVRVPQRRPAQPRNPAFRVN
jgi:hypothetical protein